MTNHPDPTEEEAPSILPVLRCLICAEPVLYVVTPSFEGWEHNYAAIGERLKNTSAAVVQKSLEADPLCYNGMGILEVTSGTYDGPWDSERKTYSTRQGLINSFKAKDAALTFFCADQLQDGKTWVDILHPQRHRQCECVSCTAKLRAEDLLKPMKGGETRRSGGPDDPPVYA